MDCPNSPPKFHDHLTNGGFIDEIYTAMEHDDVSEVVMTALKILKKSGGLPSVQHKPKDRHASFMIRNYGNDCYSMDQNQAALAAYNKALLYAPNDSEEMKLAYSNRSALLLKMKCFNACLIDIQTCMNMDCTEDIVKKLKKRKKECEESLWQDILKDNNCKAFGNVFEFNVERHPQIPCVSKDIEIVIEDQLPKVVAAKNIKVGTLVALEVPFVTQITKETYEQTCYFCHNISLNLMPCEGCTYALFCSVKCKEKCRKEYHSIECKMFAHLEEFFPTPGSRLVFKAALKMKQMCSSWKEFIEASYKIGRDRMKNSSISEIFDGNNKFSLLSFDDSKNNLILGTIYNFSFRCASIIEALEQISFFPYLHEDKIAAMRALARVIVNLYVSFPNKLLLNQTAENIQMERVGSTSQIHLYWLAFANKLKHSCNANIIPLALHNKVALVALRPIKKGAELNIPYIDHWYERSFFNRRARAQSLYQIAHETCNCQVCTESWHPNRLEDLTLSDAKRRYYHKWIVTVRNSLTPHYNHIAYVKTCEALAMFDEAKNTREHLQIFNEFRKILHMYQFVMTKNIILGDAPFG